MCTINTESFKKDIPIPKKFKKFVGLQATLPYTKPFTLSATAIPTDPTPNQKLKFRGHRKMLNDELKSERDAYFAKIEKDKYRKLILEYSSAIKIQALFRGYIKRPGYHKYTMRRYNRINPNLKELQFELSVLAMNLGLKPLPGLTLPLPRGRRNEALKFQVAAAIRLQCFFRMVAPRLKYMKHRQLKNFDKISRAFFIIRKFMKYVYQLGQKERDINIQRNSAALKIQNFYRVFLSRKW